MIEHREPERSHPTGALPRRMPPHELGPGTFPESESLEHGRSPLRRILIATDGGYLASGGVRVGAALAERTGADVELVVIYEPRVPIPGAGAADELAYETKDREAVAGLCARVRAQVRQIAGRDVAWPLHVTVGVPAFGIERIARATRSDLVITGIGHAAPEERRIDEGTANRLAYTGTVPVLAVPPDAGSSPHVALVEVGFDEASEAAARLALALLAPGGTAYLAYVTRGGTGREADVERSTWAIQQLMQRLDRLDAAEGVVTQHLVLEGKPVPALLAAANEHRADIIATGMAGDSVEARTIMNNLAAPLLRASPVSVLVAPAPSSVDPVRAEWERPPASAAVRRRPGSVD